MREEKRKNRTKGVQAHLCTFTGNWTGLALLPGNQDFASHPEVKVNIWSKNSVCC